MARALIGHGESMPPRTPSWIADPTAPDVIENFARRARLAAEAAANDDRSTDATGTTAEPEVARLDSDRVDPEVAHFAGIPVVEASFRAGVDYHPKVLVGVGASSNNS